MTVESFSMPLVALIAACFAALLPPAASQKPPAETPAGLARAREVFRAADRDGDGLIQLGEAIRAKIPAADFAREDFDADARLSRDEFVLYYRHLLVSAGRPLARDLDVEAARIQALRRIKKPAPPRGETSKGCAMSRLPRTSIATSGPAGMRLNPRPSAPDVASNDSGRLVGDPVVPNELRDELR
jgi:hypothetical protein